MIARLLASSLLLGATLAIAQTPPPPPAPTPLPDAPGASPQAAPAPVPTGPTAVIDTTLGRLTCKLFAEQSPVATANFIGLAEG
ncbi:MAG: peptidylprolyl isomerase, partial [Acidobacteriaceae bacterium]